ncbi:gamma-glutamylcyclotransferase [Chthonobacter rhizosphaerae]|uniref:gamma-glutamylcyclotransferase n=1 Tax=Chthonobacter rhizosphaerae TaxID=2735553 RepID=UPI0015EF96F9|nr:gamma-glutamylcyclotransferase [Chthonobacter rhizosphaerae]
MLSLTPDLVALVHRVVDDPGPTPGFVPMTDDDYRELAERLLADLPAGSAPWVFAYGSLIWKPAFSSPEHRIAVARGWHRSFALKLSRWRGTPEAPGLMMVLDRGGSCRGLIYRFPDGDPVEAMIALLKREMSSKTTTNRPRWLKTETDTGPVTALAFTADRAGSAYAGRLPDPVVADVLATAVGHVGSCAEYLHNTVVHLEQHDIRDSRLWRLQAMVAERIRTRQARPAALPGVGERNG